MNVWKIVKRPSDAFIGRRSELVNPRGKEGGKGGGGGRRRDIGAYLPKEGGGEEDEDEDEDEEEEEEEDRLLRAIKIETIRWRRDWPIEKERKSTNVCEKERIEEMPGFAAPTQVEMDAVRGYP
ncbi:LOW QUALITY PROTEIN: hypothetical protein V1478_004808 [Vespula squamosa]|uniref:Uncharacterized protein n=1 Tax=Vespula squamosa TaxID=30214 RepID=A0ABD2BEU4_VESSQ